MLSARARSASGILARDAPPKRYCRNASADPAVTANSQMSIGVNYALRNQRIAGPAASSRALVSAPAQWLRVRGDAQRPRRLVELRQRLQADPIERRELAGASGGPALDLRAVRGSRCTPPTSTSKCRCGPVARPVIPT